MDIRAAIHAEIDTLSDEQLAEISRKISEIKAVPSNGRKKSLMERLREIKIDAPADLSLKILKARHGDFGDD